MIIYIASQIDFATREREREREREGKRLWSYGVTATILHTASMMQAQVQNFNCYTRNRNLT